MIYKTSFVLFLFFLFWGCDLKQAPVEINNLNSKGEKLLLLAL